MPESMEETIEILLINDQTLFRESVARFLGGEPGLKVVAHCGSTEEGLAILQQQHVDLVLLDFDSSHCDGTEFLRLAKEQDFEGKVLVVTARVEEREAAELILSGASGIFMKDNSPTLLAHVIRDAMAGKGWFDQELLQACLQAFMDSAPPNTKPQTKQFTQRELDVQSLVLEGLTNKKIAARIGVSESSVKATLQQLFSKTGVRTRSQLVRIALEQYKNRL